MTDITINDAKMVVIPGKGMMVYTEEYASGDIKIGDGVLINNMLYQVLWINNSMCPPGLGLFVTKHD